MAKRTNESTPSSEDIPSVRGDNVWVGLKLLTACVFFYSAFTTWNGSSEGGMVGTAYESLLPRRRLSMVGDSIPRYMEGLMKDLRERQKLFQETPPEEVKYWFEYTGPLQVRPNKKRMMVVPPMGLKSRVLRLWLGT